MYTNTSLLGNAPSLLLERHHINAAEFLCKVHIESVSANFMDTNPVH